jgi:RNA polymerase subunit RPABC4/transcription elongation factor Spt4
MNHNSAFKYVFFALTALVLVLFFGLLLRRAIPIFGTHTPPLIMTRPIMMALPVMVFFIIAAAIAAYVYKDARQRGLDPWLWATVAAFVPYFIGLIIYLVTRQSARRLCAKCGRSLQSDFSNCPYCGESVSMKCQKCGQAIAPDWKVCPHCAAPLNGSEK